MGRCARSSVADPGGYAPPVPTVEVRRVPTIALGGDTMLGRLVVEALRSRAAAALWSDELLEVFGEADAAIVNLECCISERGSPWDPAHKPFHFRAPPQAVETLGAAGVRAVWLANNHALDYGPDALLDTFGHLSAAGIAWVGAGRDLEEARRGVVIDVAGRRVGLVAAADHPADFAAGPARPGIAYADLRHGAAPGWLLDEVGRLRAGCDLVLVGLHWGPNMQPDPLPHHPRIARQLLDVGTDAVAGHSAHIVQAIEIVDGRPICYDLGDLLDDYATDEELRNDLGILALWRPGERLELVPLKLEFCRTTVARGEDRDWIVRRLLEISSEPGLGPRAESGRIVFDLQ
jgi:poly-gamma-glutamate synthesis protein (capsule biosynthesis protein)